MGRAKCQAMARSARLGYILCFVHALPPYVGFKYSYNACDHCLAHEACMTMSQRSVFLDLNALWFLTYIVSAGQVHVWPSVAWWGCSAAFAVCARSSCCEVEMMDLVSVIRCKGNGMQCLVTATALYLWLGQGDALTVFPTSRMLARCVDIRTIWLLIWSAAVVNGWISHLMFHWCLSQGVKGNNWAVHCSDKCWCFDGMSSFSNPKMLFLIREIAAVKF